MSAHCQLTRKRPLLGRDSLGREQREIPVLVWEWVLQEQGVGSAGQRQARDGAERYSWSCSGMAEQEQGVGPAGQRQSREGAERYSWSCLGMVSRNKTSLKCTFFYQFFEVN